MSNKFTGIIVEQTDANGKVTTTYHKTEKGLLRDHRKGRCWAFCSYCYAEGCEGADYRLPRNRKQNKCVNVSDFTVEEIARVFDVPCELLRDGK